MWFFSTRLRRWLFTTVAVPVLGGVAHKAGDALERKKGRSAATDALHKAGNLAGRKAASSSAGRGSSSAGRGRR